MPRNPSLSAPMPERLTYSIDEVATALGVSRLAVTQRIASGHLQARKMGTRVLIEAEGVRQFLASLPVAA